MSKEISAAFPFESKFLQVKGSNIHYIEEGEGDPILFLHGNPTSSYLWRNIIPHLTKQSRCIAPDLIGMGKSDKPDIDYGFRDTYAYLENFIQEMKLKNITLVIHDWGSGLGFHYAHQHPENIKGIVFMEAVYKIVDMAAMPARIQRAFTLMRNPFFNWLMLGVANFFLKKMIPNAIMRKISKEEHDYYKSPYPTIKSRKAVRVWPTEIALNGSPKYTHDIISAYHEWLKESTIPKLCLYAEPGMLIPEHEVPWIVENFPNTQAVNIGKGLHFVQEDEPDNIGLAISTWYKTL